MIAALPELALQFIDYVRLHDGRDSLRNRRHRGTLQNHFRSLVGIQNPTQHESCKGSWYSLL